MNSVKGKESGSMVLVDAGSLNDVISNQVRTGLEKYLFSPDVDPQALQHILQSGLKEPKYAPWLLLEKAVVYDGLVIDANAINSRHLEDTVEHLSVEGFPISVFDGTSHYSTVREKLWSLVAEANQSSYPARPQWNPGDKEFHDFIRSGIASSDDSWSALRAWFYVILADELRLPLLLNYAKSRILDSMHGELQRTIHDLVVHQLDASLVDAIWKELRTLPVAVRLTMPPILTWIFNMAIQNGTSILDATLELRGREEVADYRKFIGGLEDLKRQGIGGLLEVQSRIDALGDRVVERLRRMSVPGQDRATLTIAASQLTWLDQYLLRHNGHVFHQAFTAFVALVSPYFPDVDVPLPIRRRYADHVNFVSSWYN